MEFMTGVKEKETLELSELLAEGRLGWTEVKVNGAVHTIRDMGDSRFRDSAKTGRSCCSVYTKKALQQFNLKDSREAATVEVSSDN